MPPISRLPHPGEPSDQAINAWYESQSEDLLRDLFERFDADTPRKAWLAFFSDCSPPATQTAPASLPASAAAGQGEGAHDIQCDECGWSGFDDGWMVYCPMCNFLSLYRGPRS